MRIGKDICIAFATTMLLSVCLGGTAFAAPNTGAPSADAPQHGAYIGKKAARLIAFEDAGVKKKQCKDVSVQLRPKAGTKVYIVRFVYKKIKRFNYSINAANGQIVSYYTKHA